MKIPVVLCGLAFAGLEVAAVSNTPDFAALKPKGEEFIADIWNPALPPVEILPVPAGEPVELVKDGRLRFCLVGDFRKEAEVRGPERDGKSVSIRQWGRDSRWQCALRLQECFEATVGAKPEILECDDPRVARFAAVIVCGKCKYTESRGVDPDGLPFEGFEIRTFSGGVIIAGMDGYEIPGTYDGFNWRCKRMKCNGTELGGIDFAERFLGVRKYGFADKAAGLAWEHFPKVTNLTLPPCAYRDHPRQRLRWLKTPWRDGVSSDFFGGEAPFPGQLIKAHPDELEDIFYRDPAGRLWCDAKSYGMNFLDVSNPRLADILVRDYRTHYESQGSRGYWGDCWAPSGRYLWFGQCDKVIEIDNGRSRRLFADGRGSTQNRIYHEFHRALAEKCKAAFPGKTLVVMAYHNFLDAPASAEPFPDNVQVMACVGTPLFVRSPAYVARWKENYSAWNALCPSGLKCVPYTYDAGYNEDEAILQALRGYFEGEFYRAVADWTDPALSYNCMYEMGSKYHYSTYLSNLAMWNPRTDADAVIREYFRLMYGRAAEPLTHFYYGLIDRWVNHYLPLVDKATRSSIPGPNLDKLYTKTFTAEACRGLLDDLDRAEKALEPGSMEMRRFKWFAKPFRGILPDILAYQSISYPTIRVPKAKGWIVIDGVPDEAEWKRSEVPAFHRAFAGGDRPVISPETHLLWDEDGLYVALRSPQPYTDGSALWNGDVFEVLLAPHEKPTNLYQFLLDPAGHYEDYWKQVDPPRGKEINWRAPGVRTAAKKDADAWTGEIFIPWGNLSPDEHPKAGEVWKLNLVYNRLKPNEYISLSPTLNNNHRTDMYAYLRFCD